MRKAFSFLLGASLPVIAIVAITGCQSDSKQTTAPAQSSAASSAAPAAPAQTATPAPAKVATAAPAQAATTTAAVPTTATTVRIKAGATAAFKDSSGNTWLPDQGFDGGDTVERPDAPITGTKDPGLYQSEHYSMSSFSYKIPNGKYIAKLHFCETFEGISGKGDRVFTVNVQNGQKIIKDLDVFDKAGGANKAYVETVPVEVTNGVFKIDFVSNVENPQINAIEITPQS